jgi:hypothetical protein
VIIVAKFWSGCRRRARNMDASRAHNEKLRAEARAKKIAQLVDEVR